MSNATADGTTEQRLKGRGKFVVRTRMKNDALILLGAERDAQSHRKQDPLEELPAVSIVYVLF